MTAIVMPASMVINRLNDPCGVLLYGESTMPLSALKHQDRRSAAQRDSRPPARPWPHRLRRQALIGSGLPPAVPWILFDRRI